MTPACSELPGPAPRATLAGMDRPHPHPDPLTQIGLRFEVAMAESHARAHPDDFDAQRLLAYAYTGAGLHAQALEADLRLVALHPERSELHYDLACSYALLDRADEAFAALDAAVELGFDDLEHLGDDDDLASLHLDPRWSALVRRLEKATEAE